MYVIIIFIKNGKILIPKVGLKFMKAGTYIIETNFNINTKKNRDLGFIFLNYIHNKTTYKQYSSVETTVTYEGYSMWSTYMRFDIKRDDTLDIKLYAGEVTYEDIFESFTNSSINIYYIEYLGLSNG